MSTGLCGYNGCHSGASEWLDTASDVELLGAGGGKELTMVVIVSDHTGDLYL